MNFARIWCITNRTPARRVTPPWTFTWQNLTPAERVTNRAIRLGGSPQISFKRHQIKMEIIWTGGLPHLSWLPHLPGVPHLHVNSPYSVIKPSLLRERAKIWYWLVRSHFGVSRNDKTKTETKTLHLQHFFWWLIRFFAIPAQLWREKTKFYKVYLRMRTARR